MDELATTKEGGLHFILSDNGNYDFDVKVDHCKLVGFVKDVIDRKCLRCVFCERHILYQHLFYNIPPKFFFFFFIT